MNNSYTRIAAVTDGAELFLKAQNQAPAALPADGNIPHGDMPGDKIEIEENHIMKAERIYPKLLELLTDAAAHNPYGRVTVTVCGGSGVGKSETASLLSYYLNEAGIGSYTLSGDNYPHRIPMYNDAERVRVFRESGIRGMVDAGDLTPEHVAKLQEWQREEDDANPHHTRDHEWFQSYLQAGSKGLAGYLGTKNETDYDEVTAILKAFHDGADTLSLRRMGRDESSLWYENVDFRNIRVLIVEWTHGNSDEMEGIDVPILLNSTPAETLEHRRSRARDGKVDSAFTTLVLNLEQRELHSQAHKAKIIVTKNGDLISYEQYQEMMDGQF